MITRSINKLPKRVHFRGALAELLQAARIAMKKIKRTKDLTREDFSLIEEPEYRSAEASYDKYYGKGIWRARRIAIFGVPLLILMQLGILLLLDVLGQMEHFHISFLISNLVSICVCVAVFVLALALNAKRVEKYYSFSFFWSIGAAFAALFVVVSFGSFAYSSTATHAALYWLSVAGLAAVSFAASYLRVTCRIKKGEYRKGGGGFWSKRLRHFGGRHLKSLSVALEAFGIGGFLLLAITARMIARAYPPEILILAAFVIVTGFPFLGYAIGVHNLAYRRFGIKNPSFSKLK